MTEKNKTKQQKNKNKKNPAVTLRIEVLLVWLFNLIELETWKENLEQTVTDFYGKPIDKREERQTRKNYLFTYLWILLYHLRIRKSYTQKENWIKPSDTHESFYICYGAVRIGWKKLWFSKIRSLHKSKYVHLFSFCLNHVTLGMT